MSSELDFVRKLARSFALANGHSHPEEYADAVAAAHAAQDAPPAETSSGEAQTNGTAAETPAATTAASEPAQDAPASGS